MSKRTKYLLNQNQMPRYGYNRQADLPRASAPGRSMACPQQLENRFPGRAPVIGEVKCSLFV